MDILLALKLKLLKNNETKKSLVGGRSNEDKHTLSIAADLNNFEEIVKKAEFSRVVF